MWKRKEVWSVRALNPIFRKRRPSHVQTRKLRDLSLRQARKQYFERRSLSSVALYCYLSLMLIYNLRNKGQSQACTIALCGEKWIKDVFEMLWCDSRPVVDHADPRLFSEVIEGHLHCSSRLTCIDCILN